MSTASLRARVTSAGGVRRLLAAIPLWVWLAALIVASIAIRTALAKRHPAPWIFGDELLYWRLAVNFAHSGHFFFRDTPGLNGLGPGYPLLISPAPAFFGDLAHAYAVAKAMNAVLMSLAAVPAYFLARRVLSRPFALAAAVFALALPSLQYTGVIMTENAFYPAFMLCVLAFAWMLERPSTARQLLALASVLPAFLIRAQAAILLFALVTAILVLVAADAWAAGELRTPARVLRRLDSFRATWLALGAAVVLAVGAEVARGRSPESVLGAYGVLTGSTYSVTAVARWWMYHLAELDLYLGFVPFAALIVVVAEALRRSERSRPLRVFASLSVSLALWFTLITGAYATQLATPFFIGRIEERNDFYVAPLFLIALLIWVERGLPRRRLFALAAAIAAAALPATIPYDKLANLSALADTLALIPLARASINGRLDPSHFTLAVTVAAVVGALVFLLLPRRLALLAPVAVLAYLIAWQASVERQMRDTSQGVLAQSIGGRREWIDDHAGGGSRVTVLWTGNASVNSIEENEFFNRSVQRATGIEGGPPLQVGTAPTPTVSLRRSGSLVDAQGTPLPAGLYLSDPSAPLTGKPLAKDPVTGLALYRAQGPPRLASRLQGRYSDGWTAPVLDDMIYRCRPGRLRLLFSRYPGLVPGPQTVVARVNGRRVARVTLASDRRGGAIDAPLRPDARGRCDVSFTVSPTASPLAVLGTPDGRVLGVHEDLLEFAPRR